MSLNHGINTNKSSTTLIAVQEAAVGIPFFIGCWPCHQGGGFTGRPQLAYSFEEARQMGGYSDEWRDAGGAPKWSLCQAMYSHFRLFKMAPAVFYNCYNPELHKAAVAAAPFPVAEHTATLPEDAVNNASLSVNNGANTLVQGTDYKTYYDDGKLIVELLTGGSAYDAATLTIGYDRADLTGVTATTIGAAIERIEGCKAMLNVVPDLICCPGWSQTPPIAALMETKAASINGFYKSKAVVDLDTGTAAADSYEKVAAYKTENGYTGENMIVCWPQVKVGTLLFDYSVILCGMMATVDVGNGNVPYESPSNKPLPITACVNKAGAEINLSPPEADTLSYSDGVVTALNFDGWRVWGNYTGCWPESRDIADYFICTSRMVDYISNSFVNRYWSYLDRPMTRVLIDAIVNEFNAWLGGLTAEGKLYGGSIQYVADRNANADIIGGRFRLDTAVASTVPAQRCDIFIEFDLAMLSASINA